MSYYYTRFEQHREFIRETLIRTYTKDYNLILWDTHYNSFILDNKQMDNYYLRFHFNYKDFTVNAQFYDNKPVMMTIISSDNTVKVLRFHYCNYSKGLVFIDGICYNFEHRDESIKYC